MAIGLNKEEQGASRDGGEDQGVKRSSGSPPHPLPLLPILGSHGQMISLETFNRRELKRKAGWNLSRNQVALS